MCEYEDSRRLWRRGYVAFVVVDDDDDEGAAAD